MRVIYSDQHTGHDPQQFILRGRMKRSNEQPERATLLLEAARSQGHEIVAPEDHGAGPRAAVHTPQYLRFLETAWERWQQLEGASEEVMPNIHPFPGQPCTYPDSVVGQAGYHMGDMASSIGRHTWHAAVWSATQPRMPRNWCSMANVWPTRCAARRVTMPSLTAPAASPT
jgi:acetoin utilization deacetylase AcuC-like enzyme